MYNHKKYHSRENVFIYMFAQRASRLNIFRIMLHANLKKVILRKTRSKFYALCGISVRRAAVKSTVASLILRISVCNFWDIFFKCITIDLCKNRIFLRGKPLTRGSPLNYFFSGKRKHIPCSDKVWRWCLLFRFRQIIRSHPDWFFDNTENCKNFCIYMEHRKWNRAGWNIVMVDDILAVWVSHE